METGTHPFVERIESLTRIQRILIVSGLFILLVAAFVYFLYWPKYKSIDRLQVKLKDLEKKLITAKRNAADLEKFQAKMQEAEIQFKIALLALPEKEEIPSLLTSVSKSGQDVGLEFLLFEPKAERKKDFYAEIPVSINVLGNYHDITSFFDKVARLSRIVNINDIAIDRTKNGDTLSTSCTAVTYKFIEGPPPEVESKGKAKKPSGRRKPKLKQKK